MKKTFIYNLISCFLISTLGFTLTHAAAPTTNVATQTAVAFKKMRTATSPLAKNKLRIQIAQNLQALQLSEASLLYVYQVLKSKEVQNLNQALPVLDKTIGKTPELNLYRMVPPAILQKFESPAFKAYSISEKVKSLIQNKKLSEADELISENEKIPLLGSRYALATAFLANGDMKNAQRFYNQVLERKSNAAPDDRQKGLALLGIARAAYQAKDWAQAATLYRELPKDHPYYRRSLMELSWSLFRSGQFRSALSPLHTLHSDYYEGFYQPESLYLRAMILMFTCRYDEASTAFNIFNSTYKNAYFEMRKWMDEPIQEKRNLEELFQVSDAASKNMTEKLNPKNLHLPFFVLRTAVDEPELDALIKKQKALVKEKNKAETVFKNSVPLKKQLVSFINRRMQRNQAKIVDSLSTIVVNYATQAEAWFTLMDLAQLEIIEGQKNIAKENQNMPAPTAIAENSESASTDITKDLSRQFFIQNGYRFWPFQGEYWRDELGNYQFIGNNLCAKETQSDEK